MWIKFDNDALESIYNDEVMPDRDGPVELSENGTANVSEELGQRLIEYYPGCHPYSTDEDEDGGDSDSADSDSK